MTDNTNYDQMTINEVRDLLRENAQQLQLVQATIEELRQPVPEPDYSGGFGSMGDVMTAVMTPKTDNSEAITKARQLQKQLEKRNYALSHALQSKTMAAARAECAAFVRNHQDDFEAAAKLFTEYRGLCGARGLPNPLPDIAQPVTQLVKYADTILPASKRKK